MIISIIAAITPSNGLGYKNTLPWHILEDFKLFKAKTLNHVLIMGGNTFRSIGKALPKRTTIVLTKEDIHMDNVITVKSIDDIWKIPRLWEQDILDNKEEIFIAGGAAIYNKFIKTADKLYLSHIKQDYTCDTFFPDYSDYKVISETPYNDFIFKEYTRG